ncbi:MAG: M14 family zinc carboxypeptidase, partial [Candidatus Aminicenantaceae bacterium]
MRLAHRIKNLPAICLVLLFVCLSMSPLSGQTGITSPRDFFGHNIGDDYFLASYFQAKAYWEKLTEESDRMILQEIGTTEEGRTMVLAIITSPENHKNLRRFQEIAQQLALAEGLTDEKSQALAQEGCAVVWIDGGLHATEVVGAQQEIELVYQMVSRSDR